MNHLLAAEGRRRLEAFVRTPTLYAFDFDGTLARIVRERHSASLAPPVRQRLVALGRLAPTAVISGRSLEDLRMRVGRDIPMLVGNHGLETAETPSDLRLEAQRTCGEWKRQLEGAVSEALDRAGVQVEDKEYSLTFHYRLSPRKPQARQLLFDVTGRLTPAPRLVFGKAVMNALPPGVPHKGDALLMLMKRAAVEQALYVGDDDTDEDVFALSDERILTVRVGAKQASRAQFYLQNQAEIRILLNELVNLLNRDSAVHLVG